MRLLHCIAQRIADHTVSFYSLQIIHQQLRVIFSRLVVLCKFFPSPSANHLRMPLVIFLKIPVSFILSVHLQNAFSILYHRKGNLGIWINLRSQIICAKKETAAAIPLFRFFYSIERAIFSHIHYMIILNSNSTPKSILF